MPPLSRLCRDLFENFVAIHTVDDSNYECVKWKVPTLLAEGSFNLYKN